MKNNDLLKNKWIKENAERVQNRPAEAVQANKEYRERHPELRRLEFKAPFYFRVLHNRKEIHWAIIVKEEKYSVYFIRFCGEAFDKLEFNSYKTAKRQLRKNKFLCSSNVRAPYLPVLPVIVDLRHGRKSAPYSKGNLWGKHTPRPKGIFSKPSKPAPQKPTFEEYALVLFLSLIIYSIIALIWYIGNAL